jgi:hypothetical protein
MSHINSLKFSPGTLIFQNFEVFWLSGIARAAFIKPNQSSFAGTFRLGKPGANPVSERPKPGF